MRRKLDIEVKAGAFIFLGLVVIMLTILFMGGGSSLFEKEYELLVDLPDAAGLSKGAVVKSGGIRIGHVERLDFSGNFESVRAVLLINEKFQQRIREDSVVRLQTQGVLGDKYVDISGGTSGRSAVQRGQVLSLENTKDLSAVLAEGSNAMQLLRENLANLKIITSTLAQNNRMSLLMKDMAETSENLKDFSKHLKDSNTLQELGGAMKNLRLVTEKLKNGEGTIGALLTDASLFEDLKQLIGGANRSRVLKFFVRQAVKSSDDASIEKEKEKKDPKKTSKENSSEK